MRELRFVIFVFLMGFIGFFALFYFQNSDRQNTATVLDIPSKTGKSVTINFWDTMGMGLGIMPEVQHAEFLSSSKQSYSCQISAPSKDALIIWANIGTSDFISPVQVESGSDSDLPTGLINVSIGKFDKPIYLFLQSFTGVLWNLNVPEGVEVEGVVTVSMIPSAIANVPEGAEKLVMTYEIVENSICPKFTLYPDQEPGKQIFEKEVTQYLGRKPDRMIIRESMSLAVIKGEKAPAQGISRLDARKIFSPANMLIGKQAYKDLHVEDARKSGSLIKIKRSDAIKILTSSNKAINEDKVDEIKDQFLYVSENYRLIVKDFDLPANFINQNPRTFLVPSDVELTSLMIPPSINPEPRLSPPLKAAGGSVENNEEIIDQNTGKKSFYDTVRMEKSDKYFRKIGVHSFAPLNLTTAQITELIEINLTMAEK